MCRSSGHPRGSYRSQCPNKKMNSSSPVSRILFSEEGNVSENHAQCRTKSIVVLRGYWSLVPTAQTWGLNPGSGSSSFVANGCVDHFSVSKNNREQNAIARMCGEMITYWNTIQRFLWLHFPVCTCFVANTCICVVFSERLKHTYSFGNRKSKIFFAVCEVEWLHWCSVSMQTMQTRLVCPQLSESHPDMQAHGRYCGLTSSIGFPLYNSECAS